MNKQAISIVVILVIAVGVGAFFLLENLSSRPTSEGTPDAIATDEELGISFWNFWCLRCRVSLLSASYGIQQRCLLGLGGHSL